MKKLIITFTVLLFSVSIARADFAGHLTCGQFLNNCDESKLNINCQTQTFWAMGFMSALSWVEDVGFEDNVFNKDNIKYGGSIGYAYSKIENYTSSLLVYNIGGSRAFFYNKLLIGISLENNIKIIFIT